MNLDLSEKNSGLYRGMTWNERLKSRLTELGWTAKELSKRSSLPYNNVVKYLNGEVAQPRGNAIELLAEALNVDPLWLEKDIVLHADLTNPTTDASDLQIQGEIDFEVYNRAREQANREELTIFDGPLDPVEYTKLLNNIYKDELRKKKQR